MSTEASVFKSYIMSNSNNIFVVNYSHIYLLMQDVAALNPRVCCLKATSVLC